MLDRIQKSLATLPPAERRVGQLVLQEPADFARLPVGELAARARVSRPTVVRFCRTLGYDGLSDFKSRLASELARGHETTPR
ncbi:MurR/RpiR family transcriptional regulator [Ramlibacter sp. AW1]|uniref:MurR/RpiR family transcriptional regulator n=1 Tax=Ramlibacter aurantiacus TaxID=2801330 RepID=A0A937D6X7_9BURK|nr:MurR/RpiR family transcriptional regulator [Ramlibacter aurantiacus]